VAERDVLPTHLRSKLLEAVLEFMCRCGLSEAALRAAFESALTSLLNRQRGTQPSAGDDLYIRTQNLPAQVLRVWHRDARYTDPEAKPRPLSLTRGRNSLLSIVRRLDPAADAAKVVGGMKTANLIRQTSTGSYLPTSEAAIVDRLHPLLVEHVTKLISRLVSTVSRNTDPTGKSLTLIDRHAYAADLDPGQRAAFAEFARSQGMTYLESVDDWLEHRRTTHVSRGSIRNRVRGVAAGVYLFAYLGDDEAESPLRRKGVLPRTSNRKKR